MKKQSIILILCSLILSVTIAIADDKEGESCHVDEKLVKAKKIANEITDLRSENAATLLNSDIAITPEIFKKTCGSVKNRAMEIVKKEGVKIRHAAIKNRNPKHAATEQEIGMHGYFEKNGAGSDIFEEITQEGKDYTLYVLPIFVEPACLKCHGEKESRPGFIKRNYPRDKAFGFKEGDLRGIIKVMVPK